MNTIAFAVLLILTFVLCYVTVKFLIPYVKERIGNEKYDRLKKELITLVYAVQERYGKELTGPERRAIVLQRIQEFLKAKNISLTDEQLRELNDAAVFAMKLAKKDV